MNENRGVFGVNLAHLWEEIDRVNGWMDALIGCWKRGEIAPVIAQSFPLEHAAEAHHFLQDRKNIGKVVLVP